MMTECMYLICKDKTPVHVINYHSVTDGISQRVTGVCQCTSLILVNHGVSVSEAYCSIM